MRLAAAEILRSRLRGGRTGLTGVPVMLTVLALSGLLGGCTTPFDTYRASLEGMFAAGQYAQAAAQLDEAQAKGLYGSKNELLYWLDRGSVALAMEDQSTSLNMFEQAEGYMETSRGPTAGDEIARWLINDTAAPFYGEPYEEQYVNVFKLLAQLERGELQGGATVEARRMAGKADVLRQKYLRSIEQVQKAGAKQIGGFAVPPMTGLNKRFETSGGEFIESPLGIYLTAITFMKTGDSDLQSVAGRRLTTAINAQGNLIGPVKSADFAGLGEQSPRDVNVLVVGLSGRGPTMVSQSFGPIPIYTYTLYFNLPVLTGGSAQADGARVIIDEGAIPPQDLAFVEDMRKVATANHEAQLPLIYARTFLRSSMKAAAITVGTEAARRSTSNNNTQSAIELAGIIGGLLFVTLTEKADLRCWTFLPGQAHVGTLKLPPGEHTVRIEYLRGGRVLYSTPPQKVTASDRPGDLSTVVGSYWQ